MLEHSFDQFNGVIIEHKDFDLGVDEFGYRLDLLIEQGSTQGKQLIWMDIPIESSLYIPVATARGFVFHNCLESQITLILRLKTEAYAPFVPTHSLGAGALVVNDAAELLVVKDRFSKGKGYKLPGGHIELGETINEAVVREIFEETGVKAEFDNILGFATKHPYRFEKSNMYFVCRCHPVDETIDIQDPEEIIEAKWVPIEVYLADQDNSPFNKQIVAAATGKQGLKAVELKENIGPSAKFEVYFQR